FCAAPSPTLPLTKSLSTPAAAGVDRDLVRGRVGDGAAQKKSFRPHCWAKNVSLRMKGSVASRRSILNTN
ncbi:MAG: hypothetical protein IJ761_01205, partial [Bacteroidales bacterium]|nr:hypothetical protein [Bacteroidales bacterium]